MSHIMIIHDETSINVVMFNFYFNACHHCQIYVNSVLHATWNFTSLLAFVHVRSFHF